MPDQKLSDERIAELEKIAAIDSEPSDLEPLLAKMRRLEEALRPFALMADTYGDCSDNALAVARGGLCVLVKHFREARAALRQEGGQG